MNVLITVKMLFPEKNEFIMNKHVVSSKLLIPGILLSRYVYNFETDYRKVTGDFPPISNEKNNMMITDMNTCLKTGLDVLNILNFGFNSYISVSTIIGDANSNIIKNTKVVRVSNLLFHSYVTCGLINYTYSLSS